MKTKAITLEAYEDMLKSFDWLYDFSDDSRVRNAGCEKELFLRDASCISPEHKALFDKYRAVAWSIVNKGK